MGVYVELLTRTALQVYKLPDFRENQAVIFYIF